MDEKTLKFKLNEYDLEKHDWMSQEVFDRWSCVIFDDSLDEPTRKRIAELQRNRKGSKDETTD